MTAREVSAPLAIFAIIVCTMVGLISGMTYEYRRAQSDRPIYAHSPEGCAQIGMVHNGWMAGRLDKLEAERKEKE